MGFVSPTPPTSYVAVSWCLWVGLSKKNKCQQDFDICIAGASVGIDVVVDIGMDMAMIAGVDVVVDFLFIFF